MKYPRTSVYGFCRGGHSDGWPLRNPDGSLNDAQLDLHARYSVVVLDAAPLLWYPEIAEALKKRNPAMTLLLFNTAHAVWNNPSAGAEDFAHQRWLALAHYGEKAFVWAKDGRLFPGCNVNFAHWAVPWALSHHDARAIAETGVMPSWDRTRALADGLFLDLCCPTLAWMQTPEQQFDFVRAGFPDFPSFERAWQNGRRAYVEGLRWHIGDKLLVGNCGPGSDPDVFNGWCREAFPAQNGGTWESNMVGTAPGIWPGPGYLLDGERYLRPPLSFLNIIATGNHAEDERRLRFVLASATLGEGCGVIVPPPDEAGHPAIRGMVDIWIPEMDLNLGAPAGTAVLANDGRWTRSFEHGLVEVRPGERSGRFIT